MALKDIILGRFAWNRSRREKGPGPLDGMSLDERRQAIQALVSASSAPRVIRLRAGAATFNIEAGNGQLHEVEQRDASGVVYRFDCAARPAATVSDAERSALRAQFVGFLDEGKGRMTVEVEPITDGRSRHQGLSPEVLTAAGDRHENSDMPVQILTSEDDELGPMAEVGPDDFAEPEAVAPPRPAAGLVAAAADTIEFDTDDYVEPEPFDDDAPDAAPVPAAARPARPARARAPALALDGRSELLRDYAGRLRGHVLETGLRSEVAPGQVDTAEGIERFAAAVAPHLGSTLLVACLGSDDIVDSHAVALDSGDAVAIRFRRSRAGKLFQEWSALTFNKP